MDSPRALPDEARNLPAALLDLRGLLAPVGFELFLRLLLRVSARPEVVEHRRLLNVAGVRHDNAGREPRVMRVRDEGVPHRSGCSGCRTPGTASSPGPSSPPSVSPPPSPFTQYLRAAPASTPPASSPANSQVRKKANAAPLTLLEAEEFRRVPAERSRGASPHAVIPPGIAERVRTGSGRSGGPLPCARCQQAARASVKDRRRVLRRCNQSVVGCDFRAADPETAGDVERATRGNAFSPS